MKISRGERRAFIVLCAVVVVCCMGFFGYKAYTRHVAEEAESRDLAAMEAASKKFALGEWISLDSKEDSCTLPSGESFSPIADAWDGELDVRIDGAFTTDKEGASKYATPYSYSHWYEDDETTRYLVVRATIKNVSATPVEKTRGGNRWFSADALLGMVTQDNPLVLFSGTPSNVLEDPTSVLYFDLAKGEEAVYDFVFAIRVPDETLDLRLGLSPNMPKYRVDVDSEVGEDDVS